MKSDDAIVLVAEVSFRFDENDSTDAVIPLNNGWSPLAEGDKVVVGIAAVKLEPGSKRCGQFKVDGMLENYANYCHATEHVQWSIDLCELDGVNQGVSAADMAVKLFKRSGYRKICAIREEGDQGDPEGVSTEPLEHLPATRNNL